MEKEKVSRAFDDKCRLVARGLPEIREAMDSEIDRLRYKHKLRIGDEPINLTSLGNALLKHYLDLSEAERDKVIIPAAMLLDHVLRQPEATEPQPLARGIAVIGPFRELDRDNEAPKILAKPKRRR